jgi:hypothetical protein
VRLYSWSIISLIDTTSTSELGFLRRCFIAAAPIKAIWLTDCFASKGVGWLTSLEGLVPSAFGGSF